MQYHPDTGRYGMGDQTDEHVAGYGPGLSYGRKKSGDAGRKYLAEPEIPQVYGSKWLSEKRDADQELCRRIFGREESSPADTQKLRYWRSGKHMPNDRGSSGSSASRWSWRRRIRRI